MPLLTRRAVATGLTAAACGLAGARPAAAATVFRLASNLPSGHPLLTRLQEAGARIKAQTNGDFDLRIFPDSQLGGDLEVLAQLRSGAVQLYPLAGAQLSTLVPLASLNGVGFAFNSIADVWRAMDGDVGAVIRKAVDDAGLYVFDKMFDNGFRQITTSSVPVKGPDDLKGLTIRVPPSPLSTSLFKAFGAIPQSISFGETYTALQTHLVQAQENPLALISSAKFFEVQKYVSMTSHMWDGFWILTNGAAWMKLSEATQKIAQAEFGHAADQERDDVAKLNDSIAGKLKEAGMTIVEPDREALRGALNKTSFYGDWKAKFGPEAWSALEKYAGKLG
jgi:TRAP-type transport system periplasmic protein